MTEEETDIQITSQDVPLSEVISKIPTLIDKDDIATMIQLQTSAIDRLETTNKSLTNCTTMAQSKLASTSKLFKKTAKTLNDSKRDLDVAYRKIQDLKAKLRVDKPDLFPSIDRTDEISD